MTISKLLLIAAAAVAISAAAEERTNAWHVSTRTDSWRLVHDGTNVVSLFSSTGITHTTNELFTGSRAECLNQVTNLHLKLQRHLVEGPQDHTNRVHRPK